MSDANGTGRRFPVIVKRLITGALKGAVLGLAIIGAIVLIGLFRVDFRDLASNTEEVVLTADFAAAYVHMRRGFLSIVAAPAVAYPLMDAVILYLATKNIPEG